MDDCSTLISLGTGTISTNRYYYHTNHLGSVIALSNASGAVIQNYSYDSFGKPYIITGSGITSLDSYVGNLYSNTRLYTAREYDSETRLYFLRARYYNTETGRFISRDPIGQNDQVNLYTYVRNSPIMYTDPDGRKIKQAVVGGWNSYMDWSDRNGEAMYNLISVIDENDVVNDLGKIRDYGGATTIAAIPFFFFPATIPIGVGITLGAGGTSLVAGATQTYVSGDIKPLAVEFGSLAIGAGVGNGLKNLGILSRVEFNTDAMRYMGKYAADSAYGFISAKTASFGYAIAQSIEQITGFTVGQLGN